MANPRPTVFPVFGSLEDLVLEILKEYFKDRDDVHIYSRYREGIDLPAIIPLSANRAGVVQYQTENDTYIRQGLIELNVIADGVDRDQVCAWLQEACRHAIYEARHYQTDYKGLGVINRVTNSSFARPETDWATSSHAVQYAKLPEGATRYEARYFFIIRPSTHFNNPFLKTTDGRNYPGPSSNKE